MALSDMIGERFMDKVSPEPMSGCWLWAAGLTGDGYGAFWINGKTVLAHRVSYEIAKGSIPESLELDHKCRNRCCVNPSHLDPVTAKVNVLRGVGISAKNARKTHCGKGHALDGENLYINSEGHRYCRKCRAVAQLSYWRKKNQREATC
jgi:hypothetical protein